MDKGLASLGVCGLVGWAFHTGVNPIVALVIFAVGFALIWVDDAG